MSGGECGAAEVLTSTKYLPPGQQYGSYTVQSTDPAHLDGCPVSTTIPDSVEQVDSHVRRVVGSPPTIARLTNVGPLIVLTTHLRTLLPHLVVHCSRSPLQPYQFPAYAMSDKVDQLPVWARGEAEAQPVLVQRAHHR